MKGENCPQLYCFNLLSFTVLLPSPFTKAMFLSALFPHSTILCVSPISVDKSLRTCVCFVLCPGKCNRASLCNICFSVASTITSVLVALKVWLCQMTFRQCGKEDGNSTGSSLYKGVWLQMLWSCCIHLPAFQEGDFSVC